MYPEEAVQAAIDAKVSHAIPVHWGAFSLALHHWKEPVSRFVSEAKKKGQSYLSPKPGAIVDIHVEKTNSWWESYD
jgi:L-ascorbate metabolism protein UlaG (beta-lactamase superfamily)